VENIMQNCKGDEKIRKKIDNIIIIILLLQYYQLKTMTYYSKIDDIRNENHKQRFINEQNCLTKDTMYKTQNTIKDNIDNARFVRVNQLETIINMINDEQKNNIKNIFDVNEIEKYMYKKPWHRLNNIQRINKLEEYIKNNLDTQQEEILKELTDLVVKNKINTKKAVDYNYENEKIISIHVLKYNKKEKVYEIKIKK